MHLIRYLDRGAARLGAVSGDVVVDVVRACAQAGIAAPDDVLSAAADPACADAIDEAQRERSNAIVETEERDLELAVPIGRPGKILALAANYPSHAKEVGEAVRDKSRSIPHVFPKLPSTLVGPAAPIVIPPISDAVDYEVEIAAVVGQRAAFVDEATALDHVAGWMVFNDVSARRVSFPRRSEVPEEDEFWDFLYGKWCEGFAIAGPHLVTRNELPDPSELTMELRVNGAVRQHARVGEMTFGVADAIAFISSICALEPGDVVTMGTPAGIGEMSQSFLRPGDVVEASIERLGTLTNPVVAASAACAPRPA
jgi:2-keto-4-pentenoate hydratase/2-oxohepta-3-ene-1,7-dioic acid hydratase in catechol pathway